MKILNETLLNIFIKYILNMSVDMQSSYEMQDCNIIIQNDTKGNDSDYP